MAVFAVIRTEKNADLGRNIKKAFPDNFFVSAEGLLWLVAAKMTNQQFSERIGVVKGSQFTGTLILRITSYYGMHSTEFWDWLQTKIETPVDG